MRNKVLTLCLAFLLVSCNDRVNSTTSNRNDTASGSVNTTTSTTSSSSSDTGKVSQSVSPTVEPEFDTFYTMNDVHGSLSEKAVNGEAGLAKLDYFVRNDADYDQGSFMVMGGDIYQGSYQAYHNMNLVNQALGKMKVKATAVGNHEFDWSADTLKNLNATSPFPILGANVVNSKDDWKQVSFLDRSTIVKTETGASFGIVGVIGPGEESSVKQSLIRGEGFEYRFSNEAKYIKAELDKMKDCDYKILLAHDSLDDSNRYLNTVVSTLVDDGYTLNAVVGGHTHRFESETVCGIPYVQAGSNTKGYGKFKFRRKDKKCVYYGYRRFNTPEINALSQSKLNQELYSMIHEDPYYTDGNRSLGKKLVGTLEKNNHLRKFLPVTMIDVSKRNGKKLTNPIMAVYNTGGIRDSIPGGNLTKSSLFKTSPFINSVRIQRNVLGSTIGGLISLSESTTSANYTGYYAYAIEDGKKFSQSEKYDVVTIDFVYEKSYFQKKLKGTWECIGKNSDDIIMPEVIIDYIDNYPSNTINASDFSC